MQLRRVFDVLGFSECVCVCVCVLGFEFDAIGFEVVV